MSETEKHPRRIRSFVRREGRMTPAQSQAMENLWDKYGVALEQGLLDFSQLFAREAPCIMEIGFGMGHSLLAMAQHFPQQDFLGIEVHRPGVGSLLAALEANQITNVKVFCADAVDVLMQCIPDNSLAGMQIFFPDPWPKKRHHKRRLVQAPFVELVHRKLQIGGYLHLATDWEDYAQQMLTVLEAMPGLCNQAGINNFSSRPDHRPLTKFEQRGQRLGHGVWDLIFIKNDCQQ